MQGLFAHEMGVFLEQQSGEAFQEGQGVLALELVGDAFETIIIIIIIIIIIP